MAALELYHTQKLPTQKKTKLRWAYKELVVAADVAGRFKKKTNFLYLYSSV